MKELTIGELAQYAGIQTSAIRYYESVGLLPPAKRVNGHRRYEPEVLKRLGLIQLLRQAGFGIRELQILFNSLNSTTPTAWQKLADEKIAEMDALIQQTQTTKAWLEEALERECKGIDECVVISFDETHVTLSCTTQQPTPLITMPIPTR